MRYEALEAHTLSHVEAIASSGDAAALSKAIVALCLHTPDGTAVFPIIVQAASHEDATVRGNALICFAHLARRFRALDQLVVRPIVERGLNDADTYVRGQAHAAVDDLEHFLGWRFHTDVLRGD